LPTSASIWKEGAAGSDQSGAIQQLMELARAAKTQPNMAA
jgi:hypothetical protein